MKAIFDFISDALTVDPAKDLTDHQMNSPRAYGYRPPKFVATPWTNDHGERRGKMTRQRERQIERLAAKAGRANVGKAPKDKGAWYLKRMRMV